jgi:hypothetical protein
MSIVNLHLTPDEEAGILKKGKSYVFKARPQGRTGDIFAINGRQFELIDVCERSLSMISRQYHTMDGYASPSDFVAGRKDDHGDKQGLDTKLYIHWFRDITSPKTDDLI